MRYAIILMTAAALCTTTGCLQHKVEAEVKPIHITADINIRIQVDRELDDFFDFQDQVKAEVDAATE